MEKRNRLWRKRHQWRLFKAKMVLFANYPYPHFIDDEGNCIQHPHWFDLAKQRWNYHYKSMRTPCSCWLCRRGNIAIINKKPRIYLCEACYIGSGQVVVFALIY